MKYRDWLAGLAKVEQELRLLHESGDVHDFVEAPLTTLAELLANRPRGTKARKVAELRAELTRARQDLADGFMVIVTITPPDGGTTRSLVCSASPVAGRTDYTVPMVRVDEHGWSMVQATIGVEYGGPAVRQ